MQRKYLPLMNVNFVESNPIPVKAAMALMGLLEPVWRLPHGAAQRRPTCAKIEAVLDADRPAGRHRDRQLQAEIEQLFDDKPAAYTRGASRAVRRISSAR